MKIRFVLLLALAPALFAQKVEDTGTTIRTETRVVLVDSVVTDKKGGYVHGLTQKDFRVWEDNKEQTVTSFLFQAESPSTADQTHYMVLFFDNSTARPQDQVGIRKAATDFIEANAGGKRQIAIMEFGGTLRVTQNFTDDKDRLKQVVAGIKLAVRPMDTESAKIPGYNDLQSRGMLGAVRQAANGMARTPGRKTLVLLSAGFRLNQELYSELNATIAACNRNNVAVYPIDVRGLVAPGFGSLFPGTHADLAAILAMPAAFQGRGGAAPGGASGGGAASGNSGTRGGISPSPSPGGASPVGGGARAPVTPTNPGAGSSRSASPPSNSSSNGNSVGGNGGQFNNQNRFPGNSTPFGQRNLPNLIPDLGNISGNQEVLFALASGTGGFVIANTNDLLGGLQKIGKEQNEYYVVGYTPPHEPKPGVCHNLKLKVDKSGVNVRFRTGYCDTKPLDVLSGTSAERDLEAKVKGNAAGSVPATIQSPFFYTSNNTARVNVTLDIPSDALRFVKEKGRQQATFNVIGTALSPDGGVAARFSDSVKVEFEDKKQVDEFRKKPYHYEKQFEIAAGQYTLRVAFGSGAESFGRVEVPLSVDPWTTDKFALSSLALSTKAVSAVGVALNADLALIEDEIPLIVNGVRIIPSSTNRFHKSGNGFVYAEIYEPALLEEGKEQPALGVSMMLLDPKTQAIKQDFGVTRVTPSPLPNAAVPIGMRLPLERIEPGTYLLTIVAVDASDRKMGRMSTIVIEP